MLTKGIMDWMNENIPKAKIEIGMHDDEFFVIREKSSRVRR